MVKKKRHKAFWSNIKFKYKLTIINENTLEEVVGLRVSKLNGISVLLSVLTVLFLVASVIIAFTPLRNYLPGYMNSEIRAQVVENALRVDSLPLGRSPEFVYHEYTGYFQWNHTGRYCAQYGLTDYCTRRFVDGTHTAGSGVPETI